MLLDLNEAYPIGVTYSFKNKFNELANGDNQAIASWEHPLAEYDISKAIVDEDTLTYILQFFDAVSGQTFLYQDPCDHFANDYEYEPQPDCFTTGELFPLSATEFQLCKVYRIGGLNSIRPITRPFNNSDFRINSASSYVVNWETGKVVFFTPPSETAIKWQGYFLVPVRLTEDSLTYQIESNVPEYSIPGLKFTEVKEYNHSFSRDAERPQWLNALLDLDLIVGSQITKTKKIAPMYAHSGWYKARQFWEQPKILYKTAAKTIANQDHIEAAIALWRVTIGGAIGFIYQAKRVQCLSEKLSLKAESAFNFEIDSLDLLETEQEDSVLDSLDEQTYIIPIVDSSGSMNADIPNVVSAINQLKTLAKDYIYNGSQALVDKYFKPIRYIANEQWGQWLSDDYRDDPNEPNKVLILAWINESEPIYHSGANIGPTPSYLNDLTGFQASRPNREFFTAVVYAVRWSNLATFTSFQNHLIAAYEGTSNYPVALKDYGVMIRPDLPANTPPEYYLEDLQGAGGGTKNQAANFICRCWSIEKRVASINNSDFSTTPILPRIPEPISGDLMAFVFGTYYSGNSQSPYGDCGDLKYWRSRIPVTSRMVGVRDRYFTMAIGDGTGNRSGIVPISQAQYDARTTETIAETDVPNIKKSIACIPSISEPPLALVEVKVVDAVPLQTPASPKTPAYFKFGQTDDVAYGFKAQYGGQETAIVGNVTGKITAISVFFTQAQTFALAVTDDQGNTVEPILLQKSNGSNLTYGDAPGGISNLQAIRLDGQEDTGGSLYNSQVTSQNSQVVLGFTNHDMVLDFDGVFFLPNYGGDPQAREYTEEVNSSTNTETTFFFDSEAISEEDLKDGAWNGAKFTEWIVNWNDPEVRYKIATGYLGRSTTYHNQNGGLSFKIEMRSLIARLQQRNYFITVKLCPKTFGKQGNGNCRKNLFGNIDNLQVTEIINSVTFKVNSTRTIPNYYGQLTFTSGNRAGITKLVDSFDSATKTIKLRNSANNLAVGDTLEAIAKCDRTLKACMDFDNTVNFGGFWHVPGIDKTKRTDR